MFAASKSGQVTGTTPPPPTPTNDPQFPYVTALITGDGTNGAQNNTFIDSSPNNLAVTRVGNTTQGSYSPYDGNFSSYFDGVNSYLGIAYIAGFSFGTGNFTVECWYYATATTGSVANFSNGASSNSNFSWEIYQTSATGIQISLFEGATQYVASSTGFSTNAWNHVAAVRNGNTLTIYINGVAGGTTANVTNVSANNPASAYVYIGAEANGGARITGYVSNLRLVKGTALYTTTFTPSTTPLTAVSGTQLLTCQNGNFVDNSNNSSTVFKNGNASTQAFGPFEPATLAPISYSGYFDGTGDYAVGPTSNTKFQLTSNGGTGFTVEAWIYPTGGSGTYRIISSYYSYVDGGAEQGWMLRLNSSNQVEFGNRFASVAVIGGTAPLNTWTHVAGVISGSTIYLYVNGVSVGTPTSLGSQDYTNTTFAVAAAKSNNSYTSINFFGYISNLRVVTSTLYTTTFTPSTTPLTAVSGTTILTCQSNSFVDNSINNFTITPSGDAKSVIQNPFGSLSYSQYFNGSSYLSVASNTALDFRTGNFTIELWVYSPVGFANFADAVISKGSPGNVDYATWDLQGNGTSGNLRFLGPFSTEYFSTTSQPWLTGWAHIAICRSGSSTKLFVNGTQQGSTYSGTQDFEAGNPVIIGAGFYDPPGRGSNCFISNVRLVKGTALYTTNFTPSTTPLTAVSGTSLLTCQNITAIDNSANAFTITNNSAQGSLSNPFPFGTTSALTTGYSTSVASGSVYFPSAGSTYLYAGSSTSLALGAGDFTIEGWFYIAALAPSYSTFADWRTAGSIIPSVPVLSDINNNGKLTFCYGNATSTAFIQVVESSTTMPLASWVHIAVVRSGTTVTMYFNGTSVGSGTTSQDFLLQGFTIGNNQATNYTPSMCVSNFRIVKGTAVYTSNFTPTFTPLTAITNTQLLTCQSSTSITDASTNAFTVSKYGNGTTTIANPYRITSTNGGSLYFDGTGDYLTVASSASTTNFGTGDFTVEAWVYMTSDPHASGMYLFDARTAASTGSWAMYFATGYGLSFFSGTQGGSPVSSAATYTSNQWYHVAYSRRGTSGKLFVNGVVAGSGGDSNNYNFTTVLTVASRYSIESLLQGYMVNARIVKGYALYTAAFVPPAAPTTTISGTSLLLNATNGGIYDNAMLNDFETVGNAQISTSVVKYGTGSLYFDGSGDYLFAPTANVNNLSKFLTANFTVECWIYPTTSTGDRTIICAVNNWGAGANYVIEIRSGLLFVQLGNSVTMTSGTTSISANTWTHIALVRSSNTSTTFYVNGSSVSTYTSSWTADEDCPLTIGCFNINGGSLSNYYLGYIDDLRITKYARYVANFTPPTQAFPIY